MIRSVVLGLLGLALAVAVGLGVHLVTRDTISLPVVRLQPAPALAPPAATTTARPPTTTGKTTGERVTTMEGVETERGTTDDGSGRGRGRGRGRGGDSGEGDDD